MKLRMIITAVAACAAILPSFSQSGSVKLGQMIRHTMKQAWADVEPLGHDNNGVYYLGIPWGEVMSGPVVGDADYYLLQVNREAELVKTTPFKFEIDGQDAEYEFIEEINGKTLIFTSVENRKQRTVSFYAQELDKANLKLVNAKKVVELSFAHLKREYERASFRSEVSRDKSKLLISYSLVDNEGMMLTFGYVLLDSGMKELYKWAGGLDMSDGVYLFDQFRVSNKGEVYLQTRYFSNEKAYDKNTKMKSTNVLSTTRSMEYQKNFEYRIVKFESNETNILPIPNKDRFYDALDFEIAPDGNLVVIGFYSPVVDDLMPIGATAMKINTKNGAIKESLREFGNAFEMPSDISIKNNGLAAGKDQYLKYRFILSDIKFNKDGGFTLIGERNVLQRKRNGNVFYIVNHLDDLAVVDVNAAGTITDVHKVEKSQQAEDVGIFNASYFYTEYNGKRYIAFTNLGKGSTQESILVTLTADGKQQRQVLFTSKDAEVTLRPKDCEFHNGHLVMYANKNNRNVRWIGKEL